MAKDYGGNKRQKEAEGTTVQEGGVATEKGKVLADRSKNFWAAKTQTSRNRERGAPMDFYAQVQGVDQVFIPTDEWESATTKFTNALVRFVFGSKPFLGRMRGYIKAKWGDESILKVSFLNADIFLLNFTNEQRKMEILFGGPWIFDNCPFILQQWSEHEDYKCGSVKALPVWVRLPGLKAHVSDLKILSRICSKLGKLICIDGITVDGSSYGYARVCVEVFRDVELTDKIEYQDPYGNSYVQSVMYEWRPPRCDNCYNFGHLKE
ncbi:hypothetical protein QQ045_022583 [Rhodiola kirilowii]